jgi:hypothetical protein
MSQPKWLTVLSWLIFLLPVVGLIYASATGGHWDPWSAWL